MSALSYVGRLVARCSPRQPCRAAVASRAWRLYSPKGSQLPVVEEKRRLAELGGGEKKMEKQHKSVSAPRAMWNHLTDAILRDGSLPGSVLGFFLIPAPSGSTMPSWSTPAQTLGWTLPKTRSTNSCGYAQLVMIFIARRFPETVW